MTYNEVKEQFMEDVKRELYEKKGMEVEISNNMVNKSPIWHTIHSCTLFIGNENMFPSY